MYITLRNDFHNTSARVRVAVSQDGNAQLSERQFDRLHRELCGSPECTCGIVRGPQELPSNVRVVWGPQYIGVLAGDAHAWRG